MSQQETVGCPDWTALAATRDEARADPAGWDAALAHLDGCGHCRRTAVAADPLLLFRRLPPLVVAGDEIEAMRLRVAALRGASEVTRPRRRWRSLVGHGWAAAAILVMALLGGAPSAPPNGDAARAAAPPPHSLAAELAAQPLFEELDRPFDNVVQWDGDDLSVVLVLDERFASSAGG